MDSDIDKDATIYRGKYRCFWF